MSYKYLLTVEGHEPIKVKPLTKPVLKVAMSKIAGANPDYLEAGEIILNSCATDDPTWRKIKANDEDLGDYTAAVFAAVGLIKPKKTTVTPYQPEAPQETQIQQ